MFWFLTHVDYINVLSYVVKPLWIDVCPDYNTIDKHCHFELHMRIIDIQILRVLGFETFVISYAVIFAHARASYGVLGTRCRNSC